jgi:hypothetical protein
VANPTHTLLAALVSTTVVVTAALGWAGWRLLDQQRKIDEQLARDQAERVADAVAAGIREQLAAAGERLSGWVSNPSSAVPAIDGAVVVGIRPDAIGVNPAGGLPFVPVALETPGPDRFAALEAVEFGGDRARAGVGYQALANDRDPGVRAGALVRLGRVSARCATSPPRWRRIVSSLRSAPCASIT